MDNRMTGRRIIIILLGLVLISGAVFAVTTLTGGSLFGPNDALAQPSDDSLNQNVVVPVTGSGVDNKSVDSSYMESEYGCGHEVAEDPRDW